MIMSRLISWYERDALWLGEPIEPLAIGRKFLHNYIFSLLHNYTTWRDKKRSKL